MGSLEVLVVWPPTSGVLGARYVLGVLIARIKARFVRPQLASLELSHWPPSPRPTINRRQYRRQQQHQTKGTIIDCRCASQVAFKRIKLYVSRLNCANRSLNRLTHTHNNFYTHTQASYHQLSECCCCRFLFHMYQKVLAIGN